jgi:hypothetical protein
MDRNTELLLAKAGQLTRWEDEEKATNDVEQLREEFRRRLYGGGAGTSLAEQMKGSVASGAATDGLCRED